MIQWTPALSTGIPLLDEQHQTIFRWLAELENATAEQRTLFGAYAITRLQSYVRDHFSAEEALMRAAGYPDLDRHVAEHEAFRRRLAELQLRAMVQDASSETVEFLRDWLVNHIGKTDMAYVPCLGRVPHR
jgi:hemerythrin-like metal-binding protein